MRRSLQLALGLAALGVLIALLLVLLRVPRRPEVFDQVSAVIQIRGVERVGSKVLEQAWRVRPDLRRVDGRLVSCHHAERIAEQVG